MLHSRTHKTDNHNALARNKSQLNPQRIALFYALFASLWIFFSDTLLAWLISDPQQLARLSIYKGLAFVLTTTVLLYLLLRVWREPMPRDAPQVMMKKTRANRRPWGIVLLLGMVPLLGYSIIHLHGPSMELGVEQNLLSVVQLKANQIENWLDERRGDGLVFVENTMFAESVAQWRQTNDREIRSHIEARLRSVQHAYGEQGFAYLNLVSPEGEFLLGDEQYTTPHPQTRQTLEQSLERRAILYSDIYPGDDGSMQLDFIVPLFLPSGEAIAAVIMHVDPEHFVFPAITAWPGVSLSVETLLLQRYTNRIGLIYAERPVEDDAWLDELQVKLQQADKGYYQGVGHRGEAVMAAYTSIANTPWVLISKGTRSEALAPLYSLALWVTLIGFFATLAITAALLLLWQYQRRIHRLALLAQEAEMGHMLQYFYDSPLIGMAILSAPDRQLLRFNGHLCEMLGHEHETLQQQHWTDLLDKVSYQDEQQALQRILDKETDRYQQELHFSHRDGHRLSMLTNLQAVRTDDGEIDFFIVTLQDITERFEHERVLQHQRDLYNVISHTNQSIVRCKTKEALFRNICNISIDYGHFRFARLMTVDQANHKLHTLAACSQEIFIKPAMTVQFHSLRLDEAGPAEQMCHSGKAVVIDPIRESASLTPWHATALHHQVAGMALIPIHTHGELFGCIALYASETGYFRPEVLATLHEMAMDVGFALENFERALALEVANHVVESSPVVLFRWLNQPGWPMEYVSENVRRWGYSADVLINGELLYEDIIHPSDRERILLEVQQNVLHQINSFQQVYRLIHPDGRVIWVEDHSIIERDKQGNTLAISGVVSDITERQEADERFRALVEQSLAGIFMLRGRHVHYANPRAEQIFGYEIQSTQNIHIKHFISPSDRRRLMEQLAGVLSGAQKNGALQFQGIHKNGQLMTIGAHVSRATIDGKPMLIGVLQDITEKLHAEEQIRQYLQQLELAMDGTVHAISYMVELRDPYTSGHERRVGEIASAIAREMGMDDAFQRAIQLIGGLHDVGKITVPAEILSKPGKLTKMEFEIIKAHAQQGYEILKNIQFPWPVAETVLQHHERVDGSGYPQGLKGDAIILEARIISVADVVESMASHRPYRPGLVSTSPWKRSNKGQEGCMTRKWRRPACACSASVITSFRFSSLSESSYAEPEHSNFTHAT